MSESGTQLSHRPLRIWGLCMILLLAWLFTGTRVVTDMSQFLPEGASGTEAVLLEQIRSGVASRTLLLGISGSDPSRLAAASDFLRQQLLVSGDFEAVDNGRRDLSPRGNPLLYRYRFLLSGETDDYQLPGLRRGLDRQLEILRSSMIQTRLNDPSRDPVSAWPRYLQRIRPDNGPRLVHGVWFDAEETHALLLARTEAPAFEMSNQQRVLAGLEAALQNSADHQGLKLDMSGPALFALQARDIISSEATLISVASTVLVTALLILVFRHPAPVLLAAVPLLTGIAAAVAMVNLLHGSIHGITLAFGITIIGVAVDYPLHLFLHKRVDETGTATLARIWPVLRLGLATTVTGYLAMLLSGFTGLVQLGVFAVTGLVAAVLVTRLVLPGMLARDWQVRHWYLPTLPSAGRAVKAALWLLFAAAVVISVSSDPWQRDIAALNPQLDRQRATDDFLRGALAAPDTRHFILVSDRDTEAVLQRLEHAEPVLEAMISDGVIAGYQSAHRFLPSRQRQQQRQQSLPAAAVLADRLAGALRGLPFNEQAFAPFVQDLEQSRSLPPLGPEQLHDDVAGAALQGLLFAGGDGWHGLVPLTGIGDYDALKAAVETLPGARLLDLKQASSQLMAAWRDRALVLLAIGAGVILLMLRAGTGSVPQALRVALPVAAAVLLTVAVLLLLGEKLSLFHLASLLLVTGIALDYSLFFHAPTRDPDQHQRSLRAIVLCAVTTLLVFGVLALARTPVLHAIGLTVAIGTVAGLVYTLFSTGHRAGENS